LGGENITCFFNLEIKKGVQKMNKITAFAAIVAMALVVCFAVVSQVQAECRPCLTGLNCPTWKIFKDGTAIPVNWLHHKPNPRFCIYDPNSNSTEEPETWVDDVVLDKETCLIWERTPEYGENVPRTWYEAAELCYQKPLGGRLGWRQPTIEELTSLFNPTPTGFSLPEGHPFFLPSLAGIWSATTYFGNPTQAWAVSFYATFFHKVEKDSLGWAWCVRGGYGYDGY
jgi:hypothetical protein